MVTAFGFAVAVVFCLGVALAAPLLRRLFRKPALDEISPEWLESFSVERYSPMSGLLSDEDFSFLSRQPGFDQSLYRKLRRERLAIFQQYFHRIISDFNKLHVTARYLVAHSQVDQSATAKALFRIQVRFAFAVLRTQFRFYCSRFGVGGVDVNILVSRLDAMFQQLEALAVPQPA